MSRFWVLTAVLATALIAASPALAAVPANTALPTITGTAKEKQVINAQRGSWTNSPTQYTYQWQRCNAAGASCVNTGAAINSAAVSVNRTLVAGDVNFRLRISVVARNANGASPASFSTTTAIVTAAAPTNNAAPVVSGTAREGQTLSSTTGAWTSSFTVTYTRQWQRCDQAGLNCVDIAGSTSTIRVLTSADVDSRVRLRVTACNSGGCNMAFSVPTAVVLSGAPANVEAPSISGVVRQTWPLSVSNGAWTNNPSVFSYQWQRCNGSTQTCADITAASATYIPTEADVGHELRARVVAENGYGQSAAVTGMTSAVLSAKPIVIEVPQTFGVFNVGSSVGSTDGTWSGDGITTVRQWVMCNPAGGDCEDVFGANGSFYELQSATAAHSVRLRVTATNQYGSEVATSRAVLVYDEVGLDQLAFDFRPALLFDQGELWRPVSVAQWFAETGHEVCWRQEYIYTSNSEHFWERECRPLSNENLAWAVDAPVPDEDATRVKDGDKQIYVEFSHSENDGADYARAACNVPNGVPSGVNLFDCDSGNSAQIYWHAGQDANGYRYFDYWIPYRYNNVEGGPFYSNELDDHEGDWEGGSVAIDTASGAASVVGAIFSAHNDVSWLNSSELSAVVPCTNDCSSFVPTTPIGDTFRVEPHAFRTGVAHIAFFVAEGSHASYRGRCVQDCTNPSVDYPGWHEMRTGGEAAWGENVDAVCQADACVRRFPNETWLGWPGRWGSSIPNGPGLGGGAPAPATQMRYTCTEVGWACDGRAGVGVPSFALATGTRAPSVPRSPRLAPALERCRSWAGGVIAAALCNERILRRAVEDHRLNTPGAFRLRLRGKTSGSIPGLSQAVGRPLRLGEPIKLLGQIPQGTALLVRVEHKKQVQLVVVRVPALKTPFVARPKLILGKVRITWSKR